MQWWMWILRIVFGIILGVAIGGAGLFGYIAWKARAKKWSAGMFGIVAISVFLFYWLILGNPWNVIPF